MAELERWYSFGLTETLAGISIGWDIHGHFHFMAFKGTTLFAIYLMANASCRRPPNRSAQAQSEHIWKGEKGRK
jgi:hypothetical protein